MIRSLTLMAFSLAVQTFVRAQDTWQGLPPFPGDDRISHTAVWTGSEMIVWGGQEIGSNVPFSTGARFDVAKSIWTPVGSSPISGRSSHSAVWTGREMIVWGGRDADKQNTNTGGRYNPATDKWIATTTIGAPAGRYLHTAIWTGTEMIVWGGAAQGSVDSGARYNPSTDTWLPMSSLEGPSARSNHTAVWTGKEMAVWGGNKSLDSLKDGALYRPATDTWIAMATLGAPEARLWHTAIWTGSEVIIWGGFQTTSANPYVKALNTGGRYHPGSDTWTETSRVDVPQQRYWHSAVWTGTEMIIWGGHGPLNTGGRYVPTTDAWKPLSMAGAAAKRHKHNAVWTGTEMIVCAGTDGSQAFVDTFSYLPAPLAFQVLTVAQQDRNLILRFPTSAGSTYTLWSSETLADGTWTDTGLPAIAGTGAILSFSVPTNAVSGLFHLQVTTP
jgi:N-acetylneuraminic acid mutarotase